jgi:hypothetical protein
MKPTPALEDPRLCRWFHEGAGPPAPGQPTAAAMLFQAKPAAGDIGFPPAGGRDVQDFAVFLLHAAAEIEHSLLIQYLYAAYSLNDENEQLKPDRTTVALSWKNVIRVVARQEMAHLVTVQNLLLALNQDVYLNRGSVHGEPDIQPVPFRLEPLSVESLAKYVATESPSDTQMDAATKRAMKPVRRIVKRLSHVEAISRVGILYTALYWLFLPSDTPGTAWAFPRRWIKELMDTYQPGFHLKARDFVSIRQYRDKAALPQEWGIYESQAHADSGSPRRAALSAIRWIMEQGEGLARMQRVPSHFDRFLHIFQQAHAMRSRAFKQLVFNVPVNPIAQSRTPRKGATPIEHPVSRTLGELLNLRYQLLLLDTMLSLDSSRRTEEGARRRYAKWALAEMEFVKKIGQMLPHFPRRRRRPHLAAGAPFQTQWMPPERDRRVALEKRLLARSVLHLSVLRHEKWARSNPLLASVSPVILALVPSLLDAIARQDDNMRRVFD